MPRAVLAFSLFVAPLALLGCSSGDDSNGDGDGGGGGGEPFDPGAVVTPFHATFPTVTIPSGGEKTQCVTFRLDNPEAVYVRRFATELTNGSHHMILYHSSETAEQKTPFECQGFSGLLQGDHPIFIAQQEKSSLVMPKDAAGKPVALKLGAREMVRLEMHYFNTTPDSFDVGGDIRLDTIPLSTDVVESDLAFWGTDKFDGENSGASIPANGELDTGVIFQAALPGTSTFALTTHQHQLGTQMSVWFGTEADVGKKDPVVESHNWQDPPLAIFEPAIEYDTSRLQGLAYQCHWVNTTPFDVNFGESVNDEMCFLWHYYYPSQGFQLCVNGACVVTAQQ